MAAKKKGSARKRRKVKVIVFILELIVLLVVLAALYVSIKMSKLDSGEKIKEEDHKVNEDIKDQTVEALEKYRNIALFGLDNRSNGNFEEGNSDVILDEAQPFHLLIRKMDMACVPAQRPLHEVLIHLVRERGEMIGIAHLKADDGN